MDCLERLLKQVKSLAEKNRLWIVLLLLEYQELCVCQIIEFLGLAGATVSRHINKLVEAGLLRQRKEGRWIYVSLSKEAIPSAILEWLLTEKERSQLWEGETQCARAIIKRDKSELCRCQKKSIS